MKARPILFSGPMVRALLDDSKTQTRRVVKLPHNNRLGQWEPTVIGGDNGGRTAAGDTVPMQGGIWHTRTGDSLMCPHGQPGDRLWVRETWGYRCGVLGDGGRIVEAAIEYSADHEKRAIALPENGESMLPKQRPCRADERYADYYDGYLTRYWAQWRPSIHMPRWASRITLEVTGVRVERLHDITDAHALAEGVDRTNTSIPGYARERFIRLWTSINGNESWTADPWVWVVEFKRVT